MITDIAVAADDRNSDEPRTKRYWETRYAAGGISGSGSRSNLATYKRRFLNKFVLENKIQSVFELGCGDGYQLSNVVYPKYTGFDISANAVKLCSDQFKDDKTKDFLQLALFRRFEGADLGLSIDVVYHLLEDDVYRDHIASLFTKSRKFVIIYGNDVVYKYKAGHVRLRNFVGDIAEHYPQWKLVSFVRNPAYDPGGRTANKTWANFYVFQRQPVSARPPLAPAAVEPKDDADAVLRKAIRDCFQSCDLLNAPEMLTAEVDVSHSDRTATGRARVGLDGKVSVLEFGDEQVADMLASRAPDGGVSLLVIDRSPASMAAVLEAERRGFWRDISGFATSAAARNRFFFLTPCPPRIVVSLTTISQRVGQISKIVAALLAQSMPADEIVLNVSTEGYLLDEGVSEQMLPEDVRNLRDSGLLTIDFVENTGPYRKLINVAKQHADRNTIIITCDDDYMVPRDWIHLLVREFAISNSSVAFRVRRMTRAAGAYDNYLNWPIVKVGARRSRAHFDNIATGNHGILYHTDFFDRKLFDKEFQACAPGADDLFFKICLMLNRVKTAQVHLSPEDYRFYDTRFVTAGTPGPKLYSGNKLDNNDKWRQLVAYALKKYGKAARRFFEQAPPPPPPSAQD